MFEVRRTTEADRTYIARLNFLTDVFGDESKETSSNFEAETEVYVDQWDPEDDGVIAMHGKIPAGGAWLIWGDVENHGVGFVDERTPEIAIAIEAPYRGKGLATTLLEAVTELARENGAPAVSLAVVPGNEHAKKVYEHLGFALAEDAEDTEHSEYVTLVKKF